MTASSRGGAAAAVTGGEVSAVSNGGSAGFGAGVSETGGSPPITAGAAPGGGGSMTTGGTSAENQPASGGERSTEARHGFVVHEWGTNTVVSGSDGSLQIGLHHEEEDLPPFVYNRLEAAVKAPNLDPVNGNVHVKMETPVLYFYSDNALTVHASVRFPSGVFTQWYPGTVFFRPPIYWERFGTPDATPDQALDPAFDLTSPVRSASCLETYRKNGLLDWGAFEVLAPGVEPENLPNAPLASYTWSYARNVQANAVRFPNKESERFLFYRGLSNLSLPATTRALGGNLVLLSNTGDAPLAAAFLIDVQADRAAFVAYPEGVPALGSAVLATQDGAAYQPLEAFVSDLSEAVMQALVAQGLYGDESRAMVDTWQRQWFRTPGLRLLYLAPQSWTEGVIPLTLDPIPDSLVRVMMVRVEMLTPEIEAEDRAALAQMESDPSASRGHFAAAGRFAEPRLRRALTLVPSSAGEAYLNELVTEVSRLGALGQ